MKRVTPFLLVFCLAGSSIAVGQSDDSTALPKSFRWDASEPLLAVDPEKLPPSADNPWHAVKDPSVVRYQGRWHLFCTLRKLHGEMPGYIRIGYISFKDWQDAPNAPWHLLEMSPGYHAAPQVFFFAPHNKWYLIYQLADETRDIPFGPCFSTTQDITDPTSWTRPEPIYQQKPGNVKGWLDFWVICDSAKAHLFFTSLNGKMWRAETKLSEFPRGFAAPEIVLEDDVFEASHTYRVQGAQQYLTLIEAQAHRGERGRRYFKAYVADSLEGEWKPWAAKPDSPFAGAINVRFPAGKWTDSISHGELIRTGIDQNLEVDPSNLQFLFQGLLDGQWSGGYGQLAWRLGLLKPTVEKE